MERISLPGGKAILPLGLGTANFGTSVSEQDAFAQMDRFMEQGGALLDTARVYGDWEPGTCGLSEKTVGRWLSSRGARERVVLVTKGGHPPLDNMALSRVTPAAIRQDLAQSLSHLQTDYVDFYLLHRDDPTVPVGEILDCLEEQRQQGRLRQYGCSNWSTARIEEAQAYAMRRGFAGFSVYQVQYSLPAVNRAPLARSGMCTLDGAARAFHRRTGMPVMAYMAMGGGALQKLVHTGTLPASLQEMYGNETNRALASLLREKGATPQAITRYVLAFLWEEPNFTVIALVSFRQMDQLEDCLACLTTPPDQELLDKLRGIRLQHIG